MTDLSDITYESEVKISLTVSDMLAIQSALFDAAHWNNHRGWIQSASVIEALRKRWQEKTSLFVDEADRKCSEWLKTREDQQ